MRSVAGGEEALVHPLCGPRSSSNEVAFGENGRIVRRSQNTLVERHSVEDIGDGPVQQAIAAESSRSILFGVEPSWTYDLPPEPVGRRGRGRTNGGQFSEFPLILNEILRLRYSVAGTSKGPLMGCRPCRRTPPPLAVASASNERGRKAGSSADSIFRRYHRAETPDCHSMRADRIAKRHTRAMQLDRARWVGRVLRFTRGT